MSDFDFNFRDIVEKAMDVVIVTKADAIDAPGPEIVYVNQSFTNLTGFTKEEALGKSPRILQSSGTDSKTKFEIRSAIEEKRPVRVTIKNYSKTGQEYWLDMNIHPLKNSNGEVTHFVAIERDVTEQKNYEQKLEKLSRTDPLTGLLNRRSFNETSENEFSRFKRNGENYSVLMIDIDKFKLINDSYGHSVGDTAIQNVAHLCEKNRRLYDVLARFGGEEFCVLLPQTPVDKAFELAEKLREEVRESFFMAVGKKIKMTVSIGVAGTERSDSQHFEVIDRADEKMYEAKNSGRNRTVR
jgi:diguanylate cyclase (GGDEF)-like protein/PAS domain S-box-containing protein